MKITVCKTGFSKARGLMFSKKKNLLFVYNKPTFIGLHMLFVFFPADAIFLDENKMIVDIIHMKPFGTKYKNINEAMYILEATEEHDFKVGDELVINEDEVSKAM
jgi:uncharacterized membrane protein (UPF0127 family)